MLIRRASPASRCAPLATVEIIRFEDLSSRSSICQPIPRDRLQRHTTVRRLLALVHLPLIVCVLACRASTSDQLPKCLTHQRRSIEAALRADLNEMRRAIDDFRTDKGRPPRELGELVPHYLRRIPVDPTTHRADTWQFISETREKPSDVRSGSRSKSCAGVRYDKW